MEDKPLEVTTCDTYDGQDFKQTTTDAGVVSYSIDGVAVDKAAWTEQVKAAQNRDMISTAGEEPPELTA